MISIPAGATVVMFGDSLCHRYCWGQFADAIRSRFGAPPAYTGLTSTVGAPSTNVPTFIQKGVDGQTVAQLNSRVTADIVNQGATRVFIFGGTNDINNNTTLAADVDALIDAIVAGGIPAANIAWVPILMHGTAVPPGNADDAQIDAQNAIIAARCAAKGVTFIDVRTPYKAYRSGGGVNIASDGLHPDWQIGHVQYGIYIMTGVV